VCKFYLFHHIQRNEEIKSQDLLQKYRSFTQNIFYENHRIFVNCIIDYWKIYRCKIYRKFARIRGAIYGMKCDAAEVLYALYVPFFPFILVRLSTDNCCWRSSARERCISFEKYILIYLLHVYSNTRQDFRVQRYRNL